VADAVAKGEAELGITFTSELQPNKGVKVAGTLPAAIQLPTIYSAAIATTAGSGDAARAFLRTLAGAEPCGADESRARTARPRALNAGRKRPQATSRARSSRRR
jgi:ABC-type molybdate transport system substrate-binding protein